MKFTLLAFFDEIQLKKIILRDELFFFHPKLSRTCQHLVQDHIPWRMCTITIRIQKGIVSERENTRRITAFNKRAQLNMTLGANDIP
jgi:hypothetical protein